MGQDFPPIDAVLDLAGQTPVAEGQLQHVYAWPGRSDLLVKVVKADFADRHWTGLSGWFKRRRRLGVLTNAARTIFEHLALRAAGPFPTRHVQEFLGFVETSEGPGVVVRALRGADGRLAPTVRQLITEHRFTDQTRALVDEFGRWLVASPMIVGDLHLSNLVVAHDVVHGTRVVMIDGMGEKNLIPLNSWFPAWRRFYSRARVAHIQRAIERRLAEAAQR